MFPTNESAAPWEHVATFKPTNESAAPWEHVATLKTTNESAAPWEHVATFKPTNSPHSNRPMRAQFHGNTSPHSNRPMRAQRLGNTTPHSTPSATCSRGNGTRSLRRVRPTSRTQQCVTACDTCTCTGSSLPFSRPLRNRKTGQEVSTVAKQQLISVRSVDPIMGLQATNERMFVLAGKTLYVIRMTTSECVSRAVQCVFGCEYSLDAAFWENGFTMTGS